MPGAEEFQSESMRVISSMKWHCVIWVVGCRPRGRAVRRCSHLLASGWFTHPLCFVLILPSSPLLVATNVSKACCVHFAVDTTIPWCTCSSLQQYPTAYHTCCSVVASCRGLDNTHIFRCVWDALPDAALDMVFHIFTMVASCCSHSSYFQTAGDKSCSLVA
jgi:hypothetical protein